MSQSDNIWKLPSGVQALKDIGRDLSQGVSLCVISGTLGDIGEFEQALHYELEVKQELSTGIVHLPDLPRITPGIFQTAIHGAGRGLTLEQLIQAEHTPAVTLLSGFDKLGLPQQKEALGLLRRWADFCHTSSAEKSLCMIIPGEAANGIADFQARTTRLKLRCLIGVPSALEVQLLCRTQSGSDYISAEAQWQEMLVASLSGSDLDLAALLWQNELGDFEAILCILREYAEMRSWQPSAFERELANWKPLPKGVKPQWTQYREKMKLLRSQATVYTPEYGEEIHSAVLALLGKSNEIRHRIWRAQMALVLPMIDELCRKIFLLLEHKLLLVLDPEEIPEINSLKRAFDQIPVNSNERQQFYETVRHARDLRNKLAHVEMITFREFIKLWNSWQRINQMIVPGNGLVGRHPTTK